LPGCSSIFWAQLSRAVLKIAEDGGTIHSLDHYECDSILIILQAFGNDWSIKLISRPHTCSEIKIKIKRARNKIFDEMVMKSRKE
jgi:hypothetical protein